MQSLGPGDRYVLWLQGCNRRCFRCASPELQSSSGGTDIAVGALIDSMRQSSCSGLTISGGEPLLQLPALTELLRQVRSSLPEWDIILFTGYTLDRLEPALREQLATLVDLLIDGPYIDSLNDNVGLRGSSNQRLHFFGTKLLPFRQQLTSGPRPERQLILLGHDEMLAAGIAPANMS